MDSRQNTIFDDITMTAGSIIANTAGRNRHPIKSQEDSLYIQNSVQENPDSLCIFYDNIALKEIKLDPVVN